MLNPYWGKSFFGFFATLFQRLIPLLSGKVAPASDEIQLFILILLGASSSLVGTLLALRKMAMLANSLSHTILVGIVISYLIFTPAPGEALNLKILLIAALLTALLTTFFTEGLTKVFRLQEDASIGLVFSTLFAFGIVLITAFTRNAHIGTEVIMGNLEAVHGNDLKLMGYLFIGNGLVTGLLYKEYKVTTFDGRFAGSVGLFPSVFHYLLMIQTAATAIAAFRAVGVILVLAFLIGPPLLARRYARSLPGLFGLSFIVSLFLTLISVALSRHVLSLYQLPLSTAGILVTLILILFIITNCFYVEVNKKTCYN